ncbi:receptor-type tyrosine-protein phosphatase epsilon-like [Mytilus galloprovincialis]|uniref:receptor-type tyrosine-protein phosphatase epsilon-like n=1 Tax=Mytilus galloprovincialis TaxID=29158 RepID=UPI003F7B52F0
MDYLHMMRKDRMNMIKTHEQYETVFEALLELFTVPKMSIPRTDFFQYNYDIENMTCSLKEKLCEEFKTLETLRPSYPASKFTAANLSKNMLKNSVRNILPHDDFRPYLISYGSTRNDYINAVIIPGYKEDSSFFVTQWPIKDTIVDFWTMIYDHNSRIIVLLDPILERVQLWLERKKMMEFNDLCVIKENGSSLEELKITLNHKTKQDRRVINVLTTKEWQEGTLPSSNMMLSLLKRVGNCRDSQKCPITVVCRDGCSKSGLFVALCLILDKLELDDELDVFQAVRHVQSRRPEFMTNGDQYDYCYKCIKDLLKEQSMDENTSHI